MEMIFLSRKENYKLTKLKLGNVTNIYCIDRNQFNLSFCARIDKLNFITMNILVAVKNKNMMNFDENLLHLRNG